MPATYVSNADTCAASFDEARKAYAAGDYAAAAEALDQVFALDTTHAEGLHLRGLVALGAGDMVSAQDWIERSLEVQTHPVYYNSLCVIQNRSCAFEAAVRSARQGLALQPEMAVLHYNEGLALQHLGHLEAAAGSYRQALALAPEHSAACNNLGTILKALDDVEGAERQYRCAVALEPANRQSRSNLGHALLTLGRYDEAWAYFEDRSAGVMEVGARPSSVSSRLPLPRWEGASAAVFARSGSAPATAATRLLVTHEQGFGDNLQFVRFLPLVLARFSQVGFVCPPALRRLYEHSFGSRWPGLVMLDTLPEDFGAWDAHCPLLSLPMALGIRLDNLPAERAYLRADEQLAAGWRARLAALSGPARPSVGIVWAGGNTGWSADGARSLAPAQIAPLLSVPQVRWVSLQKADDPAKLADACGNAQLVDWMDEVKNFADTAALIDALDLVISVDTSVAHLAAAMGKPVWLLNRFAGCWRWLRGRDDSPWYPSLRLFTQATRGDWADVLGRVAAALGHELAGAVSARATGALPQHAGQPSPGELIRVDSTVRE
jgi:Flp pilus assembly protein TadD